MYDSTKLKILTDELRRELEGNLYGSPIFGMLQNYFNTIDTRIVIFDKNKKGLFINDYGLRKFEEMGFDGKKLIGMICPPNFCPLYGEECLHDKCLKTKKIITKCNVNCPLPGSNAKHHVTCLPLKNNGVSAVIEIWTEVD